MSSPRSTDRLRRPATAVALLLGACIAVPGVAWAQPAVDRGVALYEQADFEGALAALQQAEAAGDLSRSELVRLLGVRALVHFALNRQEALERDLLMLASLEPGYDLGVRAPPAVRRAFDRLREGGDGLLRIALDLEPMPGGVRVATRTPGDRAGMTQRVELAARASSGEWQRGEDGSVVLPVSEGAEIEVWARAIGPGDAVVATAGTEESPRRLRVPPMAPAAGAATASASGGTALWIGIGAGAVVVAAVAVVLAIVLGGSSDGRTILQGPTIDRGAGGS